MTWYVPVLGYRLWLTRSQRSVQQLLESLWDEDQPGSGLLGSYDAPVAVPNAILHRGGNSDAVLLFGWRVQNVSIEPDPDAWAIEDFTAIDPRPKAEFQSLITMLPDQFQTWLLHLPSVLLTQKDVIRKTENWRGPTMFCAPTLKHLA
jgi:hypothetical protein